VLDIDGVLERRIFGYPCTTAAGVRALSLLHAHEWAIAVDTARSALEVQEYCRAYGFVGGVAEYGSYIWDAVRQRGRTLVSAESLRQLDTVRDVLRQVPGVFFDDRYRHSVRAFTYEEKAPVLNRLSLPSPVRSIVSWTSDEQFPIPLPTLTVRHLSAHGLDRLSIHQTTIDTTILAKEVDKGSGLSALLSWLGQTDTDLTAIGDSKPDLPMFRVARRCFAPAQISYARLARLLGCRIDRQPYQRGLLNIVRSLVHPEGGRCRRCASCEASGPGEQGLFLELLQAADRKRPAAFLRALLDPKAYQAFLR
jgi:hydroxymethylpyrimidine pyrophosphatase-like HAD family hydrolase